MVRQDRGLTPAEETELQETLERDPRFRERFEQAAEVWTGFDRADLGGDFDWREEEPAQSWGVFRTWHGIAAVGVVLLGLGWVMLPDRGRSSTEFIIAQEESTHRLEDGSMVRINRGSELEIEDRLDRRQVQLHRGEAYFVVAPDASRPFVVAVNGFEVTAVGTEFNVRHLGDGLEVVVAEGIVDVDLAESVPAIEPTAEADRNSGVIPSGFERQRLTGGSGVKVDREWGDEMSAWEVVELPAPNLEARLAWQADLLMLGGDTLANIAESFERKTGHHMVIADPALLSLEIGGRFPSDDPRGFLQVLQNNYGIDWRENEAGELVVGSRP